MPIIAHHRHETCCPAVWRPKGSADVAARVGVTLAGGHGLVRCRALSFGVTHGLAGGVLGGDIEKTRLFTSEASVLGFCCSKDESVQRVFSVACGLTHILMEGS